MSSTLINRNLSIFFMYRHWGFVWSTFPGDTSGKGSACQRRRHKRCGFHPWVRKIPWSRKWQPTPVFLPGEFHGQRSLAGYSPWGRKVLATTEHSQIRSFNRQLAWQCKFCQREDQQTTILKQSWFFDQFIACPEFLFLGTQLLSSLQSLFVVIVTEATLPCPGGITWSRLSG